MLGKVSLFLWFSLFYCGKVCPYIAIGGEYEFIPANNCSEAYIDILRQNFGCAEGSIEYCSKGQPGDINDINRAWSSISRVGHQIMALALYKNDLLSILSSRMIASRIQGS